MKFAQSITVLAAVVLLSACQTTEKQTATPAATAVDVAALKQKWEGKWEGNWSGFEGGACTGSIDVSNVSATSADVSYAWGACGGSVPGSANDSGAKIEGGNLIVHPFREVEMVYTHIDENTLHGDYSRREGATATGTFSRGG